MCTFSYLIYDCVVQLPICTLSFYSDLALHLIRTMLDLAFGIYSFALHNCLVFGIFLVTQGRLS